MFPVFVSVSAMSEQFVSTIQLCEEIGLSRSTVNKLRRDETADVDISLTINSLLSLLRFIQTGQTFPQKHCKNWISSKVNYTQQHPHETELRLLAYAKSLTHYQRLPFRSKRPGA